MYTWALGQPSDALEQYTSSGQFNSGLKVLRPKETLRLTVTVQCGGLVGDSRFWFFLRATEYRPSTSTVSSLSTIPLDQRMNLYYSKAPGSDNTPYWWPEHKSYDPYDADIGRGHAFNDVSWSYAQSFANATKVVHQRPATSIFDIHLESREDNNTTTNLGSIIFDGTTYSLPTDTTRAAGSYSATFNPPVGYTFVSWETSGGVTVASATSQSTTVTVTGAGTLRAVYHQTPANYNVHLESRQDTSATTNLGSITLDSTLYALPADVSKTAGSYAVQYNPAAGYTFVRWETSGGVSVADASAQATTVTVSSAGTLRAVYQQIITTYAVNLSSRQDTNATTNLGSIILDATTYSLPTDASKAAGNYSASYVTPPGYTFVSWEVSGGVTVANPNAQSTTVTVSGTGTLKAVYHQTPATFNVNLSSRQDTNATTNLGSITLDSTLYALPTDVSKTAGSYAVQYNTAAGYTFVSWEVTGGVTVADASAQTTTLSVSAAGTLKAVYHQTPATFNVNLSSRQDNNATTNLGSITFDGTTYALPTDSSKTAGSYTATYNPPAGYTFLRWEVSGGVSVLDSNSRSTSATVSGAGTLKAVYQQVITVYNVHLESSQDNGSTSNLGSITLDGTANLLARDVPKTTGSYAAQYNPAAGYKFIQWECTGEVTVAAPNNQSTTVTIRGAGTLKAIYQQIISNYNINLSSRQDTNATTNLGSITFDSTTYSLPTDILKAAGSYTASYNPASGYTFVSWEVSGGVSVASATAQSTTVSVSAAGTLKAVYHLTPGNLNINLSSRQDTNATTNLGSITMAGTVYSPLPATATKPAGSYAVQYNPAAGYTFVSWETSGGVSVANASAQATTITVSAAGTLRAVYQQIPPPAYSFHVCGIAFIDSNQNGIYEPATEQTINNVYVTIFGADRNVKAEGYYPGAFTMPTPDHLNPTFTNENDLPGSYCFNLASVRPGNYFFYLTVQVPAGMVATTATTYGPIALVAGGTGPLTSLNNHFGFVAATVAPPAPAPPNPGAAPALPRPALVSSSYLCLDRERCEPGQPVIATTNVVNTGGLPGSYTVVLKINGQAVESKTVEAKPNLSTPVSFTILKSEPGTYDVEIDGQRARFTVYSPQNKQQTQPADVPLALIMAIGLLAVIALSAIVVRRRLQA